jgi:hypothetical protein
MRGRYRLFLFWCSSVLVGCKIFSLHTIVRYSVNQIKQCCRSALSLDIAKLPMLVVVFLLNELSCLKAIYDRGTHTE